MKLIHQSTDWKLTRNGQTLLASEEGFPMLFVGHGEESVDMYRGNFHIEDYIAERRPLRASSIEATDAGAVIEYGEDLSLRGICLEVADVL